MTAANRTKVEEFLKNIRSNEKSFGVITDEVVDFKIMTPEGSGLGSQIQEVINHHDRKIYETALAGFLNLSTGDGGSNALSKDQSSFFLDGLRSIATYIEGVLNEHIKDLVDMNFSNVLAYPKIVASDIGSVSMDESINSIKTAMDGGMLDITDDDRNVVRSIVNLPVLSKKQLEALALDREQKAADATALEKAKAEVILQ